MSSHRRRYPFRSTMGSAAVLLLFTVSGGSAQQSSPSLQQSPRPRPSMPPIPLPTETWDTLKLGGNGLRSGPIDLVEKDTLPHFTRELLRVQWRNGDPIELYVIRPTGIAKPPVILFLYGYPADSDRYRNNALCENLVRNGFAAVGFASALTGHRYHDRPMKEWFVSELRESLVTTVHDVQMVLNYLDSRGDLDMRRVGMFGEGSGGTIAILSAATEPRIKAVDVLDPWGDWPEWLARSPQVPDNERDAYVNSDFLSKVQPLDPTVWFPLLGERPLRLEQTLFTSTTPETARKHLLEALPPNASHVEYRDLAQYTANAVTDGKILDWLHNQLQAGRL
jgi:pimeloyl-ACP methyl ester carboxylesterase